MGRGIVTMGLGIGVRGLGIDGEGLGEGEFCHRLHRLTQNVELLHRGRRREQGGAQEKVGWNAAELSLLFFACPKKSNKRKGTTLTNHKLLLVAHACA